MREGGRIEERGARDAERARDVRYPISRWWLRPLAVRLARRWSETALRPWHFTVLNLLSLVGAVVVLLALPDWTLAAAGLVLAGWFCDRIDGALARAQGRQSATGAWLDGNIDELGDLALHGAMASIAVASVGSWAWGLFIAFLFGKYLLMYGLQTPEGMRDAQQGDTRPAAAGLVRAIYHLPANADVRVHLAIAALAAGAWNPEFLVAELALVAAYYNLRWIARYVLVLVRDSSSTPRHPIADLTR
jgi:phosphatidylglycerophosphate synthase